MTTRKKAGVFDPPADLTPAMAEAWKVIVTDLRETGTLDKTDRVYIESAAVMWGRSREARAHIERDGYIVPTVRGTTANPLLGVERESLKELRFVLQHIPLTRSARQQLGLASGPEKKSLRDAADSIGATRLRRVK